MPTEDLTILCDWCQQGIPSGDEVVIPVHPILVEMYNGKTSVTVHQGECAAMIDEQMYADWESKTFPDEELTGSFED